MSKYPDCFPPDFEDNVLLNGAKANKYNVYRISKDGKIARNNFIGSYEERLKNNPYTRPKKHDPLGSYSTSCYLSLDITKARLDNLKENEREIAFIMVGFTEPSCGLSQITFERTGKNQQNYHVDWWIYQVSNPEFYFKRHRGDNN